jgi:hypothetical protein
VFPDQRVSQLCRRLGFRLERSHLTGLPRQDRNSVAIKHPVRGETGNALAGGDDPGEIERIRGAEPDELPAAVKPPNGPELSHGFGQRELLAGHSRDEASTPDFASGLESPEDHQEIAPGGRARFASEEAFEDDTVATKQGPGYQLDGTGGSVRLSP